MTTVQPKSAETTFEEVVKYYKLHFKNNMQKINNIWRILKVLSEEVESFSYFMIRKDPKDSKRIFIEFNVEKAGDTPLHIAIKHKEYWEEIIIFGEKVKHKPEWNIGHIFIECNYSIGKEKICAYINEFIYQIKSRIDNMLVKTI